MKKSILQSKKSKGFTLIELVIALFIISAVILLFGKYQSNYIKKTNNSSKTIDRKEEVNMALDYVANAIKKSNVYYEKKYKMSLGSTDTIEKNKLFGIINDENKSRYFTFILKEDKVVYKGSGDKKKDITKLIADDFKVDNTIIEGVKEFKIELIENVFEVTIIDKNGYEVSETIALLQDNRGEE